MNENIHIGELIRKKLEEDDRSVSWLARKVYCDRSSFNKLLKKDHIDTKLLLRISKILNFNFFSYYSDFLCDKKEERKINTKQGE